MRPEPTFGISMLDTPTGRVLCERNPGGIAQPASTTKVMAARLTKEYLLAHHLTLETPVTAEAVDGRVGCLRRSFTGGHCLQRTHALVHGLDPQRCRCHVGAGPLVEVATRK